MSAELMSPALPGDFLRLPVTHRALHDLTDGRPENSVEAILAAVDAGYGIEIDLQLSANGKAMVFHDYELDRVTGETGPVDARSEAQLKAIPLTGGTATIPTFTEVLALVAGRVPLLVELKDQDKRGTHPSGTLEAQAAAAVAGYKGPLAFMSFNPEMVARMAELAPDVPRGLTTCSYEGEHFEHLSPEAKAHLQALGDFDRTGSSFISHEWKDLARDSVQALRTRGLPVLCWTLRSPEDEVRARALAENVTFEGYLSALPA
ncbi:Glycerophosphoryl diester phosphodiesterase [Pseudooceanicola antarcticus]|uniref:Glycerophosphoryl diester phosphodiesterase n=2 Tax=Pseudooceanicola antarcticus TaxID=1247613 RepID=A0A285HIV7_9RHOB|nr:Glycerophosphoryl diester phosphodiesterase [Pseudooceanicola antarcticus]